MNIATLMAAAAKRHPSSPAITDAGTTMDYATFAERAARIAGGLSAHGLVPGDRVVLCMENCGAFLEVLYGAWIAGLCPVPANSKLHPREVEHIVDNAGARLCVTTDGLAEGLARVMPSRARLIVAGSDDYRRLLGAEPRPIFECGHEVPAWIFYTSGTTGRPKGAVLTHRVIAFMSFCYYADIDHVDETDTKLHAAPMSHATGLYAIPHMSRGSHQVILRGSFDPSRIFSALEEFPNVTLFAAPTMITRMVQAAETAHVDSRNLKTLYYGGAPMYLADLKRALERFGPKLYQLFGQGESPMTITGLPKAMHVDHRHPRHEDLLASAGFPRTGVEVRVADEEDRDLPFGEVGEILTRSDCVMKEYWANPEATASTLRGGWLHTGDLGSLDRDGFLTINDRSKDLIISGGANIYPREIEEVLLQHPDVLEASVVGKPHPEWGEEVVAFVVARPGAHLDPPDLDTLCLSNIARFKRPKVYRFVSELPKSNYGKILKTELRKQLSDEGTPA